MKARILAVGALAALMGVSSAHAQLGTSSGNSNNLVGNADVPGFRGYVTGRALPSYRYGGDIGLGVVLPGEGPSYYDVPPEYGVRGYRYTIVNGRTVLVEPGSGRIVQIID